MLESSSFHEYSKKLNELLLIEREIPTLFTCNDFGFAKEVWSLMCSKDEMNQRNWRRLKKYEHVSDKYRCMIVDLLMEICTDFKLLRETFHLAVDYFDRYLYISDSVCLNKLQTVAIAALCIASKYEEIYPPKMCLLANYTDGGSSEGVKAKELEMLIEMDWNIFSITVIHWLGICLQLLSRFNGDNNNVQIKSITIPSLMRDDFVILSKVIDLLIFDHNFLSYLYRELAAAVLFCFYEPSEDIEKITCIKKESLWNLIYIVQIFVDYCEEENDKNIYHQTFDIKDIRGDEVHLIQTYDNGNNYEALRSIIASFFKWRETFNEV